MHLFDRKHLDIQNLFVLILCVSDCECASMFPRSGIILYGYRRMKSYREVAIGEKVDMNNVNREGNFDKDVLQWLNPVSRQFKSGF